MQRIPTLALVAVAFCFIATSASAGLVNVNFTSVKTSAPANDGAGFLGNGTWNRFIASEFMMSKTLIDSDGVLSGVSITGVLSGSEIDTNRTTTINGNSVQDESWAGKDPGSLLILTVSGLMAGQVYEVVVYSDRDGTGNLSDEVRVAGMSKDLPNPGSAATVLPGTEEEDFVRFFVTPDSVGEISIICSTIAGLQIQGRLTSGEAGSRIDAVVARRGGLTTGKGENRYGNGRSKKDTLSLRSKRRGVTFYPTLQNDGVQVDFCYLKLRYNVRDADVKLLDLTTGGNVRAAAAAGTYRFVLDNGDARPFKMKVNPLKEKKRQIRLRFCGMPSTKAASVSDCVTCELRQKVRR